MKWAYMKYISYALLLTLSFSKMVIAEDGSSYFQKGINYEAQMNLVKAKEQFQLAYEHGFDNNLLADRVQMYSLSVKEDVGQIREDLIHSRMAICVPVNTSRYLFSSKTKAKMANLRAMENPSLIQISNAITATYPCPFSPERSELKPATRTDIEGAWLFPESSQKLRWSLDSTAFRQSDRILARCDAVVYYPDGQVRVLELKESFSNQRVLRCFTSKKDIYDLLPQGQKTVQWEMMHDGRVRITRTDVKNHVEEWEIYVVKKDFEFAGVKFKQGDLAAYRLPILDIREDGSYVEHMSAMFRHLQRLPD